MYCVGLTGNIASGKSTVATFFKDNGITVISADEVSRELTAPNLPAYEAIHLHFGNSVIKSPGELDRSKLRQIIFTNPNERVWLEQLLHPLIREHIIHLLSVSKSPYTVVEIPLLKDRSIYPYLNRVLVVLADPEEQIRRVMARDKSSREHAQAILTTQPSNLMRQKIADDIVLNNGSLVDLREKIAQLHEKYLHLAAQNAD
ncbi:dephospho-CoA kinase [Legionella brunensis]|uniref:Dephospho-CoA kinase n=1 Tax=Legionella brunensis TaxID=29422 RepID=A0A0W0STW3_9GAMM|nr:dephospho-CoA kinase [Legionella brunensis]KTC86800.1 dephospho-CoA kinase [Legionella brunensis]